MLGYILFLVAYFLFLPLTIFNALNVRKKGYFLDTAINIDRFGNREGKLPKKSGREYFECDINYKGGFRGPERLVYSNDGLIYYTKDHYDSFELLYKEEWLW